MDPTPDPSQAESFTKALGDAERFELSELPAVLMDQLESWLELAVRMLPNLIAAMVLFVFMWLLARGVSSVAYRALGRFSSNEQVNRLLQTIIRISISAVGLFFALGILNLSGVVTSLLAGVGVIGLALGFAFQDIAANFMSGVLMAVSRPFKLTDLIETNGYFGTVETLDLRSTQLRTTTGELVLIPNKDVYNSALVNFTETSHRRVDISVGVAYGDDLRAVRAAVVACLEELEVADGGRPVDVFYEAFGDSAVEFQARFWIKTRTQRDHVAARSEAIIAIGEALANGGFSIPYPTRTLEFAGGSVPDLSA